MSKKTNKDQLIKQGERFSKVLDYLKTGIKERKNNSEVMDEINEHCSSSLIASDFSKFKNGAEIPEYVLNALYELYYINPDYILDKSEYMVDFFAEFIDKMKGKKVDESDSEQIVTPVYICSFDFYGDEIVYPVIQIDERFYNYLISVSPEKIIESYSDKKKCPNSILLNSFEREEFIDKIQSEKPKNKLYSLVSDDFLSDLLSDKSDNLYNISVLVAKDDLMNLKEEVESISQKLSKEEFDEKISEIRKKIKRLTELFENL